MGINFVENNKNLTDDEVILLINNGEYENFKIITNRYLPLIVSIAKKYCPANMVEDAVQEALFALFSAVKTYDSQKASFSTFAGLCIKRAVIAHLRKHNSKNSIPPELLIAIDEAELPFFESPESIIIEKEDFNTLANNIKLELSAKEYKVLNLFLEGKSYQEIAKTMDITEKSVDNALSRIRKKIKNSG